MTNKRCLWKDEKNTILNFEVKTTIDTFTLKVFSSLLPFLKDDDLTQEMLLDKPFDISDLKVLSFEIENNENS